MRICVGITGSIAAYRSPDLVKELKARGHEVRVVLTHAARELVSPRVLETFSENPVLSDDVFGADHSSTDHIEVARWANAFVIYAATADFLARMAVGRGDDFLSLQLLAATCPIFVAPAMNPAMWENPAVRANVDLLLARGIRFVDPIHGKVACGETGVGHIAELKDIVAAVDAAAHPLACARELKGKKILISAGPMRTALDSVRYVQNRSSGRMGLELARAFARAGAEVRVLLGPVDADIARAFAPWSPARYVGAEDYAAKLDQEFKSCDVFLSLAAVLDFEVKARPGKIDRAEIEKHPELALALKPVADQVARIAKGRRPGQHVIAFAAEAGEDRDIIDRATRKLQAKSVDAIVANPVRAGLGPEAAANELWVIRPGRETVHLGPAAKSALAEPLLEALFS